MHIVVAASAPPYPEELGKPTAGWIFDYVMPGVWVVAVVVIVAMSIRNRTIPLLGVLFLASTTMFWQEWFADWGPKLVYNRDLLLFDDWTTTWFQTYWKPVGVIFGYGLFFGAAGYVLLKLVPRAVARFAGRNRYVVTSVVAVLVFYVFDIAAEALMTAMGWYSYTDPVPPSFTTHGSMSLVFPAAPFMAYAVGLTLLLFSRDDSGLLAHERVLGVAKLSPGWRREGARLLAWSVTLNALLAITQPIPNTIIRLLFLGPSPYVP